MLSDYNTTCETAVETDTYDKIVFKISETPHPLILKTTVDWYEINNDEAVYRLT